MIQKKYWIKIIILVLIIVGCSTNEDKILTTKTSLDHNNYRNRMSHDTIDNIQNQFSINRITNFGDSIISYFNKYAGYNIKNYQTIIDTIISDNFTNINISIKTDNFKTNGIISYDIFIFRTINEANYFYNDLKTQELLLPTGIDKRPNYILVDSNRVFWHHFDNSYGHRMNDLTRIFYKKFNYHPKSSNYDTLSGPNSLHNINLKASIQELVGKWEVKKSIEILRPLSDDKHSKSYCKNLDIGRNIIHIRKDSITINRKSQYIKKISLIKLPDSKLFWKFYFFENEQKEIDQFTSDFQKKLNSLLTEKKNVFSYEVSLPEYCTLSFIMLDKNNIFLIHNNIFYEILKMK